MDKVNIIMATYQGEKYLSEQLDSIMKSSYQEFVLSIYDDGSKDGTIDVIKAYQKKYPNQIELHQNPKNIGHLHNFLQGVVNNPYPYVMFCDQDDVWNVDKIEKTLQCMKRAEAKEKNDIPIAVFTDATIVDEKLQIISKSFHETGKLDTTKLDLAHMLMENKMMGCTMMMNQKLIQKVRDIPEHARFHDWWIGLIAASFGKIVYLDQPTMLYRQHGNNVVGNVSFAEYMKNRIHNVKQQRLAINKIFEQAEEFYEQYGMELTEEKSRVLKAFLSVETAGFIQKRRLLLKYGFLKSGFIRNIGLMFLINGSLN